MTAPDDLKMKPAAGGPGRLSIELPAAPPVLTPPFARALLVALAKAHSASGGQPDAEDLSSKAS